jgi:cytoskeleton protein RodZ
MGAFGDSLRREREARGVSLGEISESTKISVGFLRALEQEDYERLPGGVFNRGFVRAYSKFLGIDEEGMVADFDAAYEQYRAEQSPPPTVESAEAKKLPLPDYLKDYRFALAVFIPLMVVITIVFVWRHHNRAVESAQSAVPVAHVDENRSPASPSAVVDVKATESPAISSSAAAEQPVKTVAATTAAGSSESQTTSKAALKTPELAAEQKPKPIRLEVHANQDSWMSVIADGKTMMEGVLPATGTRKFHAKKNIYFTTGNAGGVEVSYNGRPLPSLGTSNEVKSLTFTSDGPRQ